MGVRKRQGGSRGPGTSSSSIAPPVRCRTDAARFAKASGCRALPPRVSSKVFPTARTAKPAMRAPRACNRRRLRREAETAGVGFDPDHAAGSPRARDLGEPACGSSRGGAGFKRSPNGIARTRPESFLSRRFGRDVAGDAPFLDRCVQRLVRCRDRLECALRLLGRDPGLPVEATPTDEECEGSPKTVAMTPGPADRGREGGAVRRRRCPVRRPVLRAEFGTMRGVPRCERRSDEASAVRGLAPELISDRNTALAAGARSRRTVGHRRPRARTSRRRGGRAATAAVQRFVTSIGRIDFGSTPTSPESRAVPALDLPLLRGLHHEWGRARARGSP